MARYLCIPLPQAGRLKFNSFARARRAPVLASLPPRDRALHCPSCTKRGSPTPSITIRAASPRASTAIKLIGPTNTPPASCSARTSVLSVSVRSATIAPFSPTATSTGSRARSRKRRLPRVRQCGPMRSEPLASGSTPPHGGNKNAAPPRAAFKFLLGAFRRWRTIAPANCQAATIR